MNSRDISAAWYEYFYLKQRGERNTDALIPLECIECKGKRLDYDERQDETICIDCAVVQHFNFKCKQGLLEYLPETSIRIKKSIYKHRDYLNVKLDEISCARVKIKDEMMEKIIDELGKQKANVNLLKKILRRLGMKQKFLQIPTILNSLYPNEYPPLKLNHHTRRRIENIFLKYIDTFFILQREGRFNRKNLLNYNYVLKQIFDMENINCLNHYFTLPKGKKTIEKHADIWRQICIYNCWLRK